MEKFYEIIYNECFDSYNNIINAYPCTFHYATQNAPVSVREEVADTFARSLLFHIVNTNWSLQ